MVIWNQSEAEADGNQVTPGNSDPRPNLQPQPPPPDIQGLREHNPWAGARAGDDSDPEEADIEEHITHGPNGSIMFSQTIRSSGASPLFPGARRRRDPLREQARGPLGGGEPEDADHMVRNFQQMIGDLMGPQLRHGQPGRSGPDTLFNGPPTFTSFRAGGNGNPTIMGGRVTFTSSGPIRPRDFGAPQPQGGAPVDDLSTYAPPPSHPPNGRPQMYIISIRARPDQLRSILGSLFGPPPGAHGNDAAPGMGGMPPGLQGLFAAMLNPANARSGDAVYTQEALDQIISTLMEQHPTSNAPGPASPDAIAALPKKNLGEKELGPEGKGECSVCMDDVTIGTEVVMLPCSHWFHEACASMWLGEHNTCPICRKGIDGSESGSASPNISRRASQTPPTTRNEHRARRLSLNTYRTTRSNRDSENPMSTRNEARLDAIRSTAGLFSPTSPNEPSNSNPSPTHRWNPRASPPRVPHESRPNEEDYAGPMPGAFRRPSEMSTSSGGGEREREGRRSGSRRSSQSGGSGNGNGNGGVSGWFRDRFGANGRRD